MRRGTLFWGFILILIGFLLLLSNLGLLQVNIWTLVWPVFLIALGIWILWGVAFRRSGMTARAEAIPLESSRSARLRVQHGAGRLEVYAGSDQDNLVDGTFGGGLESTSRKEGDLLNVRMNVPQQNFPFFWWPGERLDWSFGIARGIPISLEMETGANEARIDLSDVMVTDLRFKSGASSTDLTLPAQAGFTRAVLESGAASLRIRIPPGVAARIRTSAGLSDIKVDPSRFPRSGDVYQSPDYETAQNRVDIDVKMGVGSVDIR